MDSMDHQDLAPTVQRIANEVLPAMQGDIRRIESEIKVLPAVQADIRRIETEVLPVMQGDIRRLDGSLRRVVLEMIDVKEDLSFVKKKVGKLDSIEEKIEKLTEAMDRFSGKAQSYDAARTLHGQSLTEAQVKLNDHERRIKGLEDRLQ